MAKAKLTYVEPTIELQLTKAEAETIQSILYRVGGSPINSRRKYASAVLSALHSVDVEYSTSDISEHSRSICFTEVE